MATAPILPILWWFARRSAVGERIDVSRPTAVRVAVTVG
jgi:urease beta subunit